LRDESRVQLDRRGTPVDRRAEGSNASEDRVRDERDATPSGVTWKRRPFTGRTMRPAERGMQRDERTAAIVSTL
jgi:hypothetical protein